MRSFVVVLLVAVVAGGFVQSAYGITWCFDWVMYQVNGGKHTNDTDKQNAATLRTRLEDLGYRRVLRVTAKTGPGHAQRPLPQDIELNISRVGPKVAEKLKKGDVLIFDNAHTGIVRNKTGRFDHFLQSPDKTGTSYSVIQVTRQDNYFVGPGRSWTLKQFFAFSRDSADDIQHDAYSWEDWKQWLGRIAERFTGKELQRPFLKSKAEVWRQDIVSHWEAEGDAQDSVGENHGRVVGAVAYPEGRIGQAFGLNGSSWIRVPNAADLRVSAGSFTIAAWVKLNALCAENCDQDIVSKMVIADIPNADGWRLLKQVDGHFWFCFGDPAPEGKNGCSPDASTTVRSAAAAVPGQWFHVAGVKSGGTISIFVNGAPNGSKAMSGFRDTNHAPLTIGAYAGVRGRESGMLNGLIDDVRIYSRALSPKELRELSSPSGA